MNGDAFMRYGDIANELYGIAHQITNLADTLSKIETATPAINGLNDTKLANKLTLTVAEASEMLSISKVTLYQLTHRDDFPCIRIGKKMLIPRDKLIEWINNHCKDDLG